KKKRKRKRKGKKGEIDKLDPDSLKTSREQLDYLNFLQNSLFNRQDDVKKEQNEEKKRGNRIDEILAIEHKDGNPLSIEHKNELQSAIQDYNQLLPDT